MSSPTLLPFTAQEVSGVVVVNAFAIISTLALLTVAARIVWLALRRLSDSSTSGPARETVFFNSVLGNYAACLLVANLVTGAAGIMGVAWRGGIQEGMYCTIQAIVMQGGNLANAFFTMAIGIHTFNSLVLKLRQSTLIGIITVVLGWTASGVLSALPLLLNHDAGSPYGISGLSCGIRSVYPRTMFLYHLLPILLTAILSALLYSTIFLVLRGTLVIKGGLKLTLDPNERWAGDVQNYQRFVARIARSMLWFPIAYIFFLVPYAVTRLIDLSGRVCPLPLLVIAYILWFLLGIANVLTLYNTFRVLGPAVDARSTNQKDLESFGSADVNKSRNNMAPMIATMNDSHSYRGDAMSEKSRPSSLSSFNQVLPAPSENPAAPRLLAPPIAARIQTRKQQEYAASTLSRVESNQSWSSSSSNTPSFYEYEHDGAGQEPRPLSSLIMLETPVLSAVPKRMRSTRSVRDLSPKPKSPMQSLPAPPRPVKRQVDARRPVTLSAPNSPHGSVEVRYSTSSEWSSQSDDERPEGYMPRGLVSAVGNSHNVPAIPRSSSEEPRRSGSLDRSRSAKGADHVDQLSSSEPRSGRLSTPDARPARF